MSIVEKKGIMQTLQLPSPLSSQNHALHPRKLSSRIERTSCELSKLFIYCRFSVDLDHPAKASAVETLVLLKNDYEVLKYKKYFKAYT